MLFVVSALNFQQATAQCGVNAGIDQTECAYVDFIRPMGFSVGTVPSAILWSSSGTGTFSPNATSEVVTYFPSPADKASGAIVMYLNVTNSCGVGMDTSRITFQAVPVVHAGLDVVVCSDSVFLNGSIANTPSASWVTSGTGFFINANALSTIYNVSTADKANGNVTLRLRALSTGSCASIEDTLLVSFSGASASVNAGSDRVICGNEIHLSA